MAVFKCKMCGGDLSITEGTVVAVCQYCETRQTVPSADNEKKMNLFNRANRLRINSEFDMASAVYENIVAEFPEEAEAYWGLCLCNYGIEYVDDPATGRKMPTCHRASFESIESDENFKLSMEYADISARKVYRDEAKEIDRIMDEILSISKNEDPYDVFICYKETDSETGERTVDSVLAYDIYDALTSKGYKVFFSRVTLEEKLGRQYEPYIFAALNSAKVMLAVGTKYEYFHAVWVKNEWSRFLKLMAKDKEKLLIPCYKDLDAYDLPDEFRKLQAQDLGKLGAVQDIVRGIEKIISKNDPSQVKETVIVNQSSTVNIDSLLKRGFMALEDGKFDDAKIHFDKVLDADAECAEAYLGLAMATERFTEKRDYALKSRLDNSYYKRAKQFADNNLLAELTAFENEEEEARRLEEEAKRQEEEKNRLLAEEIKRNYREIFEKYTNEQVLLNNLISVGDSFVLALKSNGICEKTGHLMCHKHNNVFNSGDIISVSASKGSSFAVCLKNDGTVRYEGNNMYNQDAVENWKNIISVSAGYNHTVGLKNDGTVVATGNNSYGQCNLSNWKNITAVSAGDRYTLGLRNDGTVLFAGGNFYDIHKNVNKWENIIAISACKRYALGLKSDGTVMFAGNNYSKIGCDISLWENIIAVSAGDDYGVGLKADGTVVAICYKENNISNVSNWKDIIAVSSGCSNIAGLKKNGTLIIAGENQYKQCSVGGITLFDDYSNLKNEQIKKTKETSTRISNGVCIRCGGAFKGMLIKKCTSCGKEKDY